MPDPFRSLANSLLRPTACFDQQFASTNSLLRPTACFDQQIILIAKMGRNSLRQAGPDLYLLATIYTPLGIRTRPTRPTRPGSLYGLLGALAISSFFLNATESVLSGLI